MSIKDFQQLLKRRFVTIILTMCCLTASLVLISMYVLKPSYQYSTQILVGNLDEFNKENSTNKTQENKQLVTSYVDILKSPLIISTVKKTLKLEQSSYELAQKNLGCEYGQLTNCNCYSKRFQSENRERHCKDIGRAITTKFSTVHKCTRCESVDGS